MKILYHSDKPELKTSPDHYFGLPNVVTFAYRNGNLLYSDKKDGKGFVFLDGKPLAIVKDIPVRQMTHSNLMRYYNEAIGSTEEKEHWRRGRTNSSRTRINLWGNLNTPEIQDMLHALKKWHILSDQPEYKVGLVSKEQGSKIYAFEPAQRTPAQISPHKEIRKKIYRRLGIESRLRNFLKKLYETLQK